MLEVAIRDHVRWIDGLNFVARGNPLIVNEKSLGLNELELVRGGELDGQSRRHV